MSVLSMSGLHKNFGAAQIIRGIDLDIEECEFHTIIGPNGAGKSTLFNLISGEFPPSSGQVTLNGRRISGLRPCRINRLGQQHLRQYERLGESARRADEVA